MKSIVFFLGRRGQGIVCGGSWFGFDWNQPDAIGGAGVHVVGGRGGEWNRGGGGRIRGLIAVAVWSAYLVLCTMVGGCGGCCCFCVLLAVCHGMSCCCSHLCACMCVWLL